VIQYRRKSQPVPSYLSLESTVLNMVVVETTLRRAGYTAEEIARMPKEKAEAISMVLRRL
jgi:hypothetical protein